MNKLIPLSLSFLSIMSVLPTPAFADRQVVWLNSEQREAFLGEMRTFMSASQQILEATLADNMQSVESAARQVGINMIKSTPPALKTKLPKGMLTLGPATHHGFEEIANEASSLGDKDVILAKLAELQKNCVACHQGYQIKVPPTKMPAQP